MNRPFLVFNLDETVFPRENPWKQPITVSKIITTIFSEGNSLQLQIQNCAARRLSFYTAVLERNVWGGGGRRS